MLKFAGYSKKVKVINNEQQYDTPKLAIFFNLRIVPQQMLTSYSHLPLRWMANGKDHVTCRICDPFKDQSFHFTSPSCCHWPYLRVGMNLLL